MKPGQPGQQAQAPRSSSSAPASPAAPPPPRWPSSATTSSASASRTRARRAHSIAAQGGINAAKNYRNDGDSRLAPVLRHGQGRRLPGPGGERLPAGPALGEHHRPGGGPGRAVRPRVRRAAWTTAPSAAPRSRAPSTPGARPASSSCSAPTRRCRGRSHTGKVEMYPRTEMLDVVLVDGHARGIVTRDLVTGEIKRWAARRGGARHRRLLARLLPVDQRHGLQRHRHLARPPARRLLRQPLLHPDPPDRHPAGRRAPVEAHPDERVAAQRRPHLGAEEDRATTRPPSQIPEAERDYYLERRYPAFGNLVPRDIASRAAKRMVRRRLRRRPDRRRRLPRLRATPSGAWASDAIDERYGNLFEMYEKITGENPLPRRRCGSTRRPTTRWAACGSTTT